jgi:predicted polyphosphate/ATP-dependent NAD kinase
VFGTFRFFGGQGTIFSASKIVTSFPIMAVATGVALLLGLVRIIAQPMRTPTSGYESYAARG